jgi:hypothetical protein
MKLTVKNASKKSNPILMGRYFACCVCFFHLRHNCFRPSPVLVLEPVQPLIPSSMLDVTSTSKGMLAPRMTAAQRIAIVTPGEWPFSLSN